MKRSAGKTSSVLKMNPKKPLCIIPARGGSKRFPKKNIALLCGKPVLAYAVEAALKSSIFEKICVTSDDEKILRIAKKAGADWAHKRSHKLASDRAQVKDVCLDILNFCIQEGDLYNTFAVLLPTSPLRRAQDIRKAYREFVESRADYCMSLIQYTHPPQRAVAVSGSKYVKPYFGRAFMKQTQRLKPLYRHDGAFIFGRTKSFLKDRDFYASKILPYFVSSDYSVDIDSAADLEYAEYIMNKRRNSQKNAYA